MGGRWQSALPPLLLRVMQLILLPDVGHPHVRMEPVDLVRAQVAETQTQAGHALHLVNVRYLLDDALSVHKHVQVRGAV